MKQVVAKFIRAMSPGAVSFGRICVFSVDRGSVGHGESGQGSWLRCVGVMLDSSLSNPEKESHEIHDVASTPGEDKCCVLATRRFPIATRLAREACVDIESVQEFQSSASG